LVVLAAVFDRTLVIRVPSDATTGLGPETLAMLLIAAGTG
jgi:hypothetical protein